jgi:hypothetical protein
MTSQDTVSSTYGVHSEVGRLHKVLVCAPGLAHRRLTPTNADDLVFDLAALGGSSPSPAKPHEWAWRPGQRRDQCSGATSVSASSKVAA